MSEYKEQQKQRQARLISASNMFDYAEGYGTTYRDKVHPYILKDGSTNLYSPIRECALQYFRENNIQWWDGKMPTGNTLSSQIMCVNHLFPLAHDRECVLSVVNGIWGCFTDVLHVMCDKNLQYISFEVVSDNDNLNEGCFTRGSKCTSIDAVILAKHQSGKIILILIEWKYTEAYYDSDKSTERLDGKEKGQERQRRYNGLIESSAQLKSLPSYQGSVYYQEPFYQLMRQTLWAEQMVAHKQMESIKADGYLHLNVIPYGNRALLGKKYKVSDANMETTWKGMLEDSSKFRIISPEKLYKPIKYNPHFSSLVEYLKQRYW